MRHHTKDKGDSGVGFVIADLLSKNIQVALPVSEHLPFDCIAISEDNRLCRLSVKYRKVDKGMVSVAFRSIWNDKHGCHIRPQDKKLFDATAIYCPNTKGCYYIRNEEVEGVSFVLRTEAPHNGQVLGVRMASRYQDPKRLFAEAANPLG